REVAGAADADDDGAAREVVGVVGDLVDGLVGERDPHAAIAVGVRHGAALRPQVLPDLGRGGVVLRPGVVEVGGVVGDGPVVGGVVRLALPDVGALRAVAEDRLLDPRGRLVGGGAVGAV